MAVVVRAKDQPAEVEERAAISKWQAVEKPDTVAMLANKFQEGSGTV